jgi:2-dehydropantoate 2-reductase
MRIKIAVIGCGAMGSVYAAKLAAAGDVVAIDSDEASMAQIARHGLRVTGPGSDQVVPLRASAVAPAETMDLIVLAVKAVDVTPGARQALPMLGAGTPVLTIQNGLGSAETVARIVGDDRLAVGIASGFGAARVAPGHVRHNAMRAMRSGRIRRCRDSTPPRSPTSPPCSGRS